MYENLPKKITKRTNFHVIMKEGFTEFFKSAYNDFLPVWKWEAPGTAVKKGKYQYKSIISICRSSQYILGVLTVLFAVCFERPRRLFFSAAFRNGLPLFLLDNFVYIVLGYFLGLKRFPANYISLVIVKTFIALEEKFKPGQLHIQAESLGQSRLYGEWIAVTAKGLYGQSQSSFQKNTGIIVVTLLGFWVVHKYTKISISKYQETVLICQTVASSWAAILLVSTFAFDAVPEFKEFHRRLCELWILFAVQALIFVVAFLFERLVQSIGRKLKPDVNFRVEWEGFIFLFIMAITIRYIPVIHKGIYPGEVLSNKTIRLLELLIPNLLMSGLNTTGAYICETWEKAARMYIGY